MNLKLTIPFALSIVACDGIDSIDRQTRDIDFSLVADNAVPESFARCAQEEDGLNISQIVLDDTPSIQRILNFDDSSFVVQQSGRELAWMSLSSMEAEEQFLFANPNGVDPARKRPPVVPVGWEALWRADEDMLYYVHVDMRMWFWELDVLVFKSIFFASSVSTSSWRVEA